MSGRIQALVRGELKKSSPKEINRMVQDFMGSELKPINTLGAVLGAAAGGLSAWISFRLAVPRDFSPGLLLAYGGLFALVGMGTNWIAIQMLFRPYGPRKTLPNCSPFVGVVPAKKSAFAKNIAQFVTQRTMNEEMIREYSGEHRGALEEAIRLWISAEDYGVVGRVLAAPALGEALSQTLLARRAELAGPLSQAVLAGLSTEALPQALRDRLLQVLGEERTAQALAALLREGLVGKTLGPWVEVSLPLLDRGLELALHTLAREADAPRLSAWLWASEDLQARFHRWTEKTTLEDLLGPARMEVLGAVLATGAQELLQKGLESILRDLEREVLHPQTPLKDLFGGILTVQLRHGGMALLEVLAKEMVAQKAAIKRNIKAEMTGLAALGRGQVDPVVDRLIDKELPAFLRRKEARILGIAETLLEHNLASLGFTPEALDTTALTQALSAVIAVPQIQDTLTRYVRLLLAQYGRLPISVLLALIKQPTLHDLLTAGEPLVTALLEVVKPRLTQGEIIRPVLRVFHRVLRDISAETSLEPLLEGLDLEPLVRGLIRRALEDREFRPWFSALLLRVLEGLQKIPDLCDPEQLREDLRVVLSGDDGAALIALWLPALRATLSQANQALTPETKAAFCGDYLIPAALDAGEARLQEILTALDIQRVVEEKVNAMDPRQIESLFYGFAGDYFRKIILYGWIGVFGGLGSYLISALLQFLF
jgi:uncharacterized membrane protein YheB (UPF0754 family)